MGKVIICPNGWAVDLKDVFRVSPIDTSDTERISFELQNNKRELMHRVIFDYYKYAEDKDTLLKKADIVRNEYIKIINDNEAPTELVSKIKFKKK